MRLLRAQFENFRLLRDLTLEFPNDPNRKLTVIRAANESGKTTMLHALQWCLYGDLGLPDKGEGFRLHPIGWNIAAGRRVPITVTIEFEIVKFNKVQGKLKESRNNYRIIRSAFEDIKGKEWSRQSSTVQLFLLSDTGSRPIDPPEAFINEELPPELREVFFTDGDRALSFIEQDVAQSTKRERVQRAIRSLLGLGVIEDALRHVKKAAAEANRQAKGVGGNTELAEIANEIDSMTNEVIKYDAELRKADEQFVAFDEKLRDIDKKIESVLRRGDRDKLRQDLEGINNAIAKLNIAIYTANKEHSQLFKSEALGSDILSPVLKKAFGKLKDLHDKGKIPNTTVPVLEERLSTEVCICGESLKEDGSNGSRRRKHICKLIEESRKADVVQETVTSLYYGSKSLEQRAGDDESSWSTLYSKIASERDNLQTLRNDQGKKMKAVEVLIDSLPDADIKEMRAFQVEFRNQRDRFNAQKAKIETQLANIQEELKQLEIKRDALLRAQSKGDRIISVLDVAKDIQTVLENAYERITKDELTKVSDLMNMIFLEMIGSDPEQGAIIRKAEISQEFDIIVYGPQDHTLNPDRDLNGASRRALTLAFILALTKVSEVEAPNVIDTPLGMTSGYVKRSILQTAIRESSQLILFLTHSEIEGCEHILDASANSVVTLTNPAHYPKMLVHNTPVTENMILLCNCNHKKSCHKCERRRDAQEITSQGS